MPDFRWAVPATHVGATSQWRRLPDGLVFAFPRAQHYADTDTLNPTLRPMPVREFTDSSGVEWRVWDVTSEQLHPVTRIEDLLDLASGWLAFQSAAEKRRLPSPYPREWADLPLPELEALCRRAPLVTRRNGRNSGEARAVEATARVDDERRTSEERRFSSPGGREWTVRTHECLTDDGSPRRVLRFTAEDIVVDIERWPHDWKESSRTDYALMLLDANPPRRRGSNGPQRRRSDRPDPE